MYITCMAVALQIRDVPEEIRDQLTAEARARGQSLQGYLLSLVTQEAIRRRNLAILAQFDNRTDGSRLEGDEAQALIDAERAERDARIQ